MISLLKVFALCCWGALLSSKNDEYDGIKTFEVYSSYITLASNMFKQKKNVNLCYGLYSRKSVTFWNQGTFSLASSVPEVHVIFKWNNLQSLGKVLIHLKTWILYTLCFTFWTSVKNVRWPISSWF